MLIRRNTGRPFAPLISSSDFSEKSSVAPTRWRRLFATKGVVYYCFMRSFAVCTSTNSPCPLHQSSNQTPRFYTPLDILPVCTVERSLHTMDIGTWIQLVIAIAAFVAVGVALYGLHDSSAKFRQQFVQAQTIAQETQYAQYRPILTPFSTLPLHMGELDSTVSELPLTLVNVGTGTALNTWGVLVPPKHVSLRPYSFRNQVPLLQENRAEVRFHFGRFLFTEKDKIGAYDLMPSSELTREDGTARSLRYA